MLFPSGVEVEGTEGGVDAEGGVEMGGLLAIAV